ncbi:hypothetical protein [Actinoallomurus iriomotensis]|uniref:Uncharacterized protein n=1 Tax=Actinoallomurus iriomotensis TaxID=478107 RepID=A0A9W6S109_9ACTN|nr:hypothetical protein [Actinoallomurus iriomotensis]GLY85139.1 hypothetical protein Airi02_030680 [Actinoallomurus iriomotensis]
MRDGERPGPEPVRFPQITEPAHGADEGLLDDVIHIGVPVQRAADGAAEHRQMRGDQFRERRLVPGLRRPDQSLDVGGDVRANGCLKAA